MQNIPEEYRNRVIDGDAWYLSDKIADSSIGLIVTDPPYGIGYKSGRRVSPGNVKPRKTKSKFGKDSYLPWMWKIFWRVLRDDSFCVVWYNWRMLDRNMRDADAAGFAVGERLFWDKRIHGMGNLKIYGNQVEQALLLMKGKPALRVKRRGNLWPYASQGYFPEGRFDHPAQKPLGVTEEWIRGLSDAGDIVFDPFCGSGTTCVAAKNTGRNFIGFEIDPEFAQLARDRLAST